MFNSKSVCAAVVVDSLKPLKSVTGEIHKRAVNEPKHAAPCPLFTAPASEAELS